MKKRQNITRSEMPTVMTIDFFSQRFNIRRELMSWGLQKVTTEERTVYLPVVMIKGSQIYVDIKKDCFASKSAIYGRTAELLPAKRKETPSTYNFSTAEGASYVFSKEDVIDFYSRKLML